MDEEKQFRRWVGLLIGCIGAASIFFFAAFATLALIAAWLGVRWLSLHT